MPLDEFYDTFTLEGGLESLNKSLRSREWIHNNIRPRRTPDNPTPIQYINHYHPGLISSQSSQSLMLQ